MLGTALLQLKRAQAQQAPRHVLLERPAAGQPHKGKVLLVIQPHWDDVPHSTAGTVAKLIQEGYTGYLVRGTNDDPEICRILGLKGNFDLNYPNHRTGDVSINEFIWRLTFLIRCLKVDTVIAHEPWGIGEENPDHYTLARGVEMACCRAGRAHDYPEQFAAGLKPHAVREKYYYARQTSITRAVDISGVIDRKIEANRADVAKGPAGHAGSCTRADLAKKGLRLPLAGDDDATADRNYVRECQLTRNRELGRQYGVEYAEAFHYVGSGRSFLPADIEVDS